MSDVIWERKSRPNAGLVLLLTVPFLGACVGGSQGSSGDIRRALVTPDVIAPDTGGNPACVADCSGKDCGDNGCGGSCGSCRPGQACQEGNCVNYCEWSLDPRCFKATVHQDIINARAAKATIYKPVAATFGKAFRIEKEQHAIFPDGLDLVFVGVGHGVPERGPETSIFSFTATRESFTQESVIFSEKPFEFTVGGTRYRIDMTRGGWLVDRPTK